VQDQAGVFARRAAGIEPHVQLEELNRLRTTHARSLPGYHQNQEPGNAGKCLKAQASSVMFSTLACP
jgi:hypothetical protein